MEIDALVVMPDNLFGTRRVQFATQAVRHAVPAVYSNREYAEVGGLMSHVPDITDTYRQFGICRGRRRLGGVLSVGQLRAQSAGPGSHQSLQIA